MNYKKLIFTLLIYLSSFLNVYSMEPDIFVQSTVNRASKILSQDLTKEQKMEKLKVIPKGVAKKVKKIPVKKSAMKPSPL